MSKPFKMDKYTLHILNSSHFKFPLPPPTYLSKAGFYAIDSSNLYTLFTLKNLFCNAKVIFFYDGMWNFSVAIVRSSALYFFIFLKKYKQASEKSANFS
ncbi:MAG: hypothetical protein LBC74_11740, partial [Planctomycetaceae bacterium]|nr:hypothetical protein [Planctomycetaceae bacterium]